MGKVLKKPGCCCRHPGYYNLKDVHEIKNIMVAVYTAA